MMNFLLKLVKVLRMKKGCPDENMTFKDEKRESSHEKKWIVKWE